MHKKNWNDDIYSRTAKKKGYPARSIFKLEEMQKKYSIVKPGDRVLDIGSSPGSWCMYAAEILKGNGTITGVDIQPMEKNIRIKNPFTFIRGDIFEADILSQVMQAGPYTVVLSDAAPSTSGDRFLDAARSFDLVKRVLEIASVCLEKNGNLVVKIFQGGDSPEVIKEMRGLFTQVKGFKPAASRQKSTETYYIGFGFIK